jgi:hypothetical protein
MMDSTVKMIESVTHLLPKPEKQDLSPMTEMVKLMLEKSDRAVERQHELELARINATGKSSETAVAKTEKTVVDQMNELSSLMDTVDKIRGTRRRSRDDEEEKKSGWLELLLQNGPQIAGTLSPVLMALAARFGLLPTPPAPTVQNAAVQQQPGAPPPPPNPMQQLMSAIAASLPPELHQWIPLIIALQGPFLAKFTQQAGPDGYALAEHIRCEGLGGDETVKGRADYMAIKEQLGPKFDNDGPDKKLIGWPFMLLVRAHPQIWATVQSLPRQLETFVTEFFTYDEMLAKEQEQAEGKAQ